MGKLKCIDIINIYNAKYSFRQSTQEFWARERIKQIGIPNKYINSTEPEIVFRLLHEIGHCEIFDGRYCQATKEFKATQWAINHSKQYNLDINEINKQLWQDYIYSFTKTKNKDKYKLDWKGEQK